MAAQGFWKGYLKLSLVTCPVAMTPATSSADKIRFHTLNRATGHRVESLYVDAQSGESVDPQDQVRGYEHAPDRFVILEDEELEAVALDSNRTLDIETFVPADSVEWLWHDTPHVLIPDDPVGEEAFAVIREAMAATGTVGLSRLVLHRRERPVMIEPRGRGLMVSTLHYSDAVRRPEACFEDIDATADADLVALVVRLIEARAHEWDPALVHDPPQEAPKRLIAGKKKHRRPARTARAPEEKPTTVVNIMDALKKCLDAERRSGGRDR